MKKTSNTSVKKTSRPKKTTPKGNYSSGWQDYYNVAEGRMKPIHPSVWKQMALDLYEEANKPNFLRLESFYQSRGILRATWYDWLPKSPELQSAHNHALEVIAVRRDTGAITRIYDQASVYKTQGYYDPVFKQEQERQAKLKIETENLEKNKTLTVELNVVEKTPDVKPLENE